MNGEVSFTPVIPPGPAMTLRMGDGPAVPTTPGGWQNVARPRRTAITEWQGQDPVTMAVPVICDGFLEDRSIENEIATLFGWLRVANGPGQTVVLRVEGPVPLTGQLWVVNGLEWGNEIRRDSDGQRTRAAVVVTLLEYVPGDVLIQARPSPAVAAATRATTAASAAAAAAPSTTSAASTPPPAGGTYTVKRGDTLALIAQRELGSSTKASQIASLNGIRDYRSIKVGQVLKMPDRNAPAPQTTPPKRSDNLTRAGIGQGGKAYI